MRKRRLVSDRASVPTLHHLYLHHVAQTFAFSLLGTHGLVELGHQHRPSAPHGGQDDDPGLLSSQDHEHQLCLLMKNQPWENGSLSPSLPHPVPQKSREPGMKFCFTRHFGHACCPKKEACCPRRVTIRTGTILRVVAKLWPWN